MADVGKSSLGIDANLAAALAYVFGWISGLIIFAVEKDNKFVKFHAMQSLIFFGGLTIISILLVITVIGPLFLGILGLAVWIICIIKAYSGEMFKLPGIGNMAENIINK
ncbi:MAG: DUF4870 domain-containing protein [Candidatus Omnitrophica bacterium]|nr:DUF4870 domain-containing protein [Candidatus Omnitrophota bacterium]MDD5310502.1 DUF4870 domain-containing protein [Candidatus Omnitrophota bacterium]MDD5546072.1 DUF4870 domain-containing protein [Candidatus Omnitrophota bacterium]